MEIEIFSSDIVKTKAAMKDLATALDSPSIFCNFLKCKSTLRLLYNVYML